jgi:hypothetical protein
MSTPTRGSFAPSVTQVLKDVRMADFDAIPEEAGEYAMERGSALHLACQYYDIETLDEDAIDETWAQYLAAWKKFRKETGFEPAMIEHSFYHPLGFCGTLDRTGRFPNNTKAILDIKTGEGEIKKWVGAQLSAYAFGALQSPMTFRRIAVRLSRTGEYKIKEFPIAQMMTDWNGFQCGLGAYNWKRS